MSSLYIPPDGVRFRLISVASPMCVVADNPLRAYTKENKFEDQWWTLEKSPNQLSSELYFITAAGGYYRGKVLGLSQRLAFVPGAGPYKDCFRLINHEEKQFEKDGGRVIGATRYERVYCEVESTNRDDQWFTFEIEEAAIDKVDYDIERGTITEGSPVVVTSWTYYRCPLHDILDNQRWAFGGNQVYLQKYLSYGYEKRSWRRKAISMKYAGNYSSIINN